ncbi:MAG TPA: DUF5103 domain-containing protein [Chitinophagaceae bacterium]|nr:DUF5103 domain-containing protein [Chitinophagaceae bacterium]
MTIRKCCCLAACLLLLLLHANAQLPDKIYMPNIKGVKFSLAGNQLGYPIINLGAAGVTELHFDDLDGNIKTYYYTFVLCNADWQPADVNPFDYLKGFLQGRFTQYRVSSYAKTKYVHYMTTLPEAGCMPKLTGNYLLKVYLNNDTAQLAFTKRLLIYNNTVAIGAQVQHPFNNELLNTHQKVQFTIDITRLKVLNPGQQLKVVVLQNYRWDNAVTGLQPMFMRGNVYEYNGERDCVFPAGKEYRWANLESYRYQSERVAGVNEQGKMTEVFLQPDPERTRFVFQTYQDFDGFFQIASTDASNPWWQGDYAKVHFVYVPQTKQPYPNTDVYVAGEMTGYNMDDSSRMEFNPGTGAYEKTMILKQGYYSYMYVTKNIHEDASKAGVALTEGNYWQTENNYTILVYYRSFSDRADELVGVTTVNSAQFMQ